MASYVIGDSRAPIVVHYNVREALYTITNALTGSMDVYYAYCV